MDGYQKSSHAVYRCEYHFVWVPKYRYQVLVNECKWRSKNAKNNGGRKTCNLKSPPNKENALERSREVNSIAFHHMRRGKVVYRNAQVERYTI
jgi:hypothetical protein